ncbi:MAG: potassium transporter TrkG, partial [Pseudomonadota bacterium]
TSGITPLSSTEGTVSSFGGELLIALFLVFALSRQTFTRDGLVSGFERFRYDHELRVGFTLAVTVPLLLFLRHWVGAISDAGDTPIFEGLQALWGGFFTVLSFLTTTGFISTSWPVAQEWSGIATPGLIFVGLALTGGGVATTAGGIKLLRVHVLYRYSQGEVERLIHPNAVGRKPRDAQVNWRQGAFIAWVFFMLFAISIALVMLALALTGLEFEASLVLAVSALSTTGPLAQIVSDNGAVYSTLSSSAQTILALSMILGRLETLAIISLLNPEFWRK